MDSKAIVAYVYHSDVLLVVAGGEILGHDFTVIFIIDGRGSYIEGVVGVGLEAGNGYGVVSVSTLGRGSVHEKNVFSLLGLRRAGKSRVGDLSDVVGLYSKDRTVGIRGYEIDFY